MCYCTMCFQTKNVKYVLLYGVVQILLFSILSITPIVYEKDGVMIRKASLGEEYEVGGWITSYSWIKLGYENDKYEPKYSDIIYVMIVNHEIIGYFMVYNIINMDENNIVPLYAKELFLYDFVVDIRAYSKYSKILIDFMLNYAKQNGYYAITINKIERAKIKNIK